MAKVTQMLKGKTFGYEANGWAFAKATSQQRVAKAK
jgi:hypothetical protein